MDRLRARTDDDAAVIVGWVPDAKALYRFAGPRLSWPLTVQQLWSSAHEAGSRAWVLDAEGQLAGHVQLTDGSYSWRLGRVLVDPVLRGRGYGRRLVEAAIEQVRRQGAQRVDLSVVKDNNPALRLYESLGFVRTADQGTPDMISMTTDLGTMRTARLRLRAWSTSEADLTRMADLYGHPEVQRWLGLPPPGGPTVLVERWEALHREDPRLGCWAIEPLDRPALAGTALIKPISPRGADLEIGWHLHPDSWGRGYATEAAALLLRRAFENGVREVYATVRPGNEPSMAVCRRLGMTPMGLTDRWTDVPCEAFRLDLTAGLRGRVPS